MLPGSAKPSNETDPPRDDGIDRSLIHTPAGSFKVDGSVHDILGRLAAEEWPIFLLSESEEPLVVRSAEVAAVQQLRSGRGRLGFRP